MTELLYQVDSYLREFEAKVVEIRGGAVILDKTAFCPRGGGLDGDTGHILKGGKSYRVVAVRHDREGGAVMHVLEGPLEGLGVGEIVRGVIDWERRYRMMRLHTASHIISAIMYSRYGALVTGGHITPEQAYDDYGIERFDRALFEDVIAEANEIAKRGLEVRVLWMRREEALRIPGVVKLAQRLPPDLPVLRIVEIPGVDVQADGGPHVRNTAEVGEIVLLRAENRGRNRKRVYFTVTP